MRFIWVLCPILVGLVTARPAVVVAANKTQTVAVMPFRDLAGGSQYIGEAIRETVTTDLKQLGSMRVIERGNLDKVLAEQGLQSQRQDLDTSTVVKLGKVLGASLIVVGAYQKLTPQVRLTARFVKVETSEIIGTAKVDGSTREFLRLQDRVTASLLRSAGFTVHAKQVEDGAEKRPELASMKTLELYGQAVTATDDAHRLQFLTLAVAEDKNFGYAIKDLEELEKRLQKYQATARELQDKELHAIREKLKTTTARPDIEQLTYKMISLLMSQRRYHTVVREARAFLDGLGPGAAITTSVDGVAMMLVTADTILKDVESLLRDGERYIQRAPGSMMFDGIKHQMENGIAQKRRIEDQKKKADDDLTNMNSEMRWDLCSVAMHYYRHEQYAAAKRLLTACFKVGTHTRSEYMEQLAQVAYGGGEWKELRQLLEEWRKQDAAKAEQWKKTFDQSCPADE